MPPHNSSPRDGDYAAHIDRLVNQSAEAPGQIAATPHPKKRRWGASATHVFQPANADPALTDEALTDPAPTDAAPAARDEVTANRRGRFGLIRYVIAGVLLFNATRELNWALRFGTDVDDFVPSIFMFAIAYILLRRARKRA